MKRTLISLFALLAVAVLSAQTVLNHDFSTVSQFEKYTVFDLNEDGQSWQYDDLLLAACCTRDYDADDRLVTPGLALNAAKTYKLTFSASLDQAGSEALRVQIAKAVDAFSPQTGKLLETKITAAASSEHSVVFTVPESGTYYLGFHCFTANDPFSNRLYLNSIVVEETINQNVPAAVSSLQAEAGANGAKQVTLSFVTPTQNVAGSQLSQLTKVTVRRDGKVLTTFDNPGMGTALTYVDKDMADGSHTYSVVPANDYGDGIGAETAAYVGFDTPGLVENLRFVYDYQTHKASLTWDAPAKGAHGGYVAPDGLTYEVRRFRDKAPLTTGITATAFTDEVGIDFLLEAERAAQQQYEDMGMNVAVNFVVDGQGLMQYYVRAKSPQGQGDETVSNSIVIGDQYELPFTESFAEGKTSHFWRTDIRTGRSRWTVMNDSRFPQDADQGMLCYNADEGNETAMCHTGNISMRSAATPVLAFYLYVPQPRSNPLVIKTAVEGGDFVKLTDIDLSDESLKGQWTRFSVPLDGCAGHDYVQVAFEATTSTTVDLLYLDNIAIFDQRAHDLSVSIPSVPRLLKVGQTRYVTASVMNLGTADVPTGQYTVDVYVGGQKAGSAMGLAVKGGEQQNSLVALQANIDMAEQSLLWAEVVYDADEVPANNSSTPQPVVVKLPRYPQATGLQAEMGADGAVLSWSVPAAPRTADGYVTESFESYPDFQRTPFGEWSLYDGDRMLTYGIGGWTFPANSDIQSWMIWTPSEVENSTTGDKGLIDKLWYPRTGDKMLASFAAYEGVSDDWLISPELSGNAQVISFYAHALPKAVNPELFQLYFSTTGAEITNFMALDATPRVAPSFKNQTFTPDSWSDCLFEYALPQGAKHFAIRKVSDDGWVMFLDDITFAPDTLAAQNGLMLFGYNIYKNGERLNAALVSTPSFTDATARPGDVYKVTAVYNEGESVYSNEVVIAGAEGITVVSAGQPKSARRVYDLQGRPAPHGAARGMTIIDGRKVVSRFL